MKAHLLYQGTGKTGPEVLLGLVVDPSELAKLQSEEDDAMPVLGRLQEVNAVRGEDGALYVLGVASMTEAVPEFTVAAYQAADAAKAAKVASLSSEDKTLFGVSTYKSDAEARAERAAAREARRLEEEAKREAILLTEVKP